MVAEAQVRQANPLLAQIDSIEALVAQINAAAAAGNWTSNYIMFHDGDGQSQNLNLIGLPAPDILNSLFQLAQSTLTTLKAQLAAL